MKVIVELDDKLTVFTFPDNSDVDYASIREWMRVTPREGDNKQASWFRLDRVLACVPDSCAFEPKRTTLARADMEGWAL